MRASSGGPCCHCGTSITPCWRKGPPEKPTLCNACGSRYLVKGDLVGYYPGARRSAARSDASMPHITKSGPRKAMSTATGSKRKSQDVDRYEGQAQLMYNNYEAMETLRYALFCAGPTSAMAAARTASDDSTDHGDQEECFQKDYQQFLDASSDDCQEPMGEMKSMSTAHAPAAAANQPEARPAMFHRRPRKQLRPVACSC